MTKKSYAGAANRHILFSCQPRNSGLSGIRGLVSGGQLRDSSPGETRFLLEQFDTENK